MAASITFDKDSLNAALKNIWGQYRTWATTSGKYKSEVSRWRNIVLMLSIGGAILGTLSQQLLQWSYAKAWLSPGLGFASGIALGLAAFFTKEIFSADPEGRAVRARAAAEALKSQAYLMATGAPPYDTAKPDTDLYATPEKVRQAVENLQAVVLTTEQKAKGVISAPMPMEDYVQQRVVDQINWYTNSAIANEKRVGKAKMLSMVFGGVGVILGLVAVAKPDIGIAAWVAVIGTITGAIAAQQFAGRYQFLILTYQAAATELERLKSQWDGTRNSLGTAADQTLILGAERVISAENSGWMVELTKKADKQ